MSALTKRQVETLLASIDTNDLLHQIVVALRWMLAAPERLGHPTDLLAEAAQCLGWNDAECRALAQGDSMMLAELAVQLAERRSLA